MKFKNLIWLVAALVSTMSCKNSSSAEEVNILNVITFNIRYNNPNDGINIWDNRKEMAADVFINYGIDIAGLQEVKKQQLDDLLGLLPGYAYVGVGRVDGKTNGEYCPIFYRKEELILMESGTQWLSESPEIIGSKGWDAALPRIFTWGKFRQIVDDQEFYFINTHFDHRGIEARIQSSKLLVDVVEELTGGDFPVIVTGDFNYTRDKEGYSILTNTGNTTPLFDTRDITLLPFDGRPHSANGFEEREKSKIIDYIFVNEGIRVKEYDILAIKKDNIYISDHYPVLSALVL